MGVHANSKPTSKMQKAAKDLYERSNRAQDYQEVMDHLEEPDFDENELMELGQ